MTAHRRKNDVVNYINKTWRSTKKDDLEYVELLHAFYTLKKYDLPCVAVFKKLISMTSKILDSAE